MWFSCTYNIKFFRISQEWNVQAYLKTEAVTFQNDSVSTNFFHSPRISYYIAPPDGISGVGGSHGDDTVVMSRVELHER